MEGELNTMVQNILQNPEFASLVKEMRGDTSENTEIDTEKIMAKLPEMLSMLGLSGSNSSPKEEKGSTDSQNSIKTEENTHSQPTALSRFLKPGSQDKRNKLLCALKPYLSPARCSLIDKTMNAIKLGEVMGVMQSVQTTTTADGKSD